MNTKICRECVQHINKTEVAFRVDFDVREIDLAGVKHGNGKALIRLVILDLTSERSSIVMVRCT